MTEVKKLNIHPIDTANIIKTLDVIVEGNKEACVFVLTNDGWQFSSFGFSRKDALGSMVEASIDGFLKVLNHEFEFSDKTPDTEYDKIKDAIKEAIHTIVEDRVNKYDLKKELLTITNSK